MAGTNMYYEDNRDLAHSRQEISVRLLGNSLVFTTDSGVFSKNAIDYGSKLLIETIKPVSGTLLDVGTGYGVMGIALAKKYDLALFLTDVNERALDLTRENLIANGIHAEVFFSDVYSDVSVKFDQIISNPPIRAGKEVVHRILSGAFDYLKDGGFLSVVIQKKQGAKSAKNKMLEVFGNCQTLAMSKGYHILQSQKTHRERRKNDLSNG